MRDVPMVRHVDEYPLYEKRVGPVDNKGILGGLTEVLIAVIFRVAVVKRKQHDSEHPRGDISCIDARLLNHQAKIIL